MKRTTKFYRKNEIDVMQSLGLKPTKNSGSGWVEKEDGQNDYLICQLKSTDAQSISVKQKDIRILEYNASVSHKLPIFAIQFLNTGEIWLMAKPEDFTQISEYINTGETKIQEPEFTMCEQKENFRKKRMIKSGSEAREKFKREKEEKYRKVKKSAL